MLNKLIKKVNNRKGFTLVEVVIVVAIIAILMAILTPVILNQVAEAQKTAGEASARTVYNAAMLYVTEQVASGKKADSLAGTLTNTELAPYVGTTDASDEYEAEITVNGDKMTVEATYYKGGKTDGAKYTYPAN